MDNFPQKYLLYAGKLKKLLVIFVRKSRFCTAYQYQQRGIIRRSKVLYVKLFKKMLFNLTYGIMYKLKLLLKPTLFRFQEGYTQRYSTFDHNKNVYQSLAALKTFLFLRSISKSRHFLQKQARFIVLILFS